jgi:hypothetical protein
MGLGVTVGMLAALVTPDSGVGTFMAFGAVAGLFMAAGAIEGHKAAGQVNSSAGAAVNVESAETVTAEAGGAPNPFTLGAAPMVPGSYSYGFYPASFEETDPDGRSAGTYDLNRDTGEIDMDGEDDSSDWVTSREAGGHSGAAVEAEPLPDVGDPDDRWRGEGDPPGVTRI